MRRITSRKHPLVGRFRDAARGDTDDVVLLDGAHLVSDALDAGLRLIDVAIASNAADDVELGALVDRLSRARVEAIAASAPVMAALSPVRSPSHIVALAERPRIDRAPLSAAGPVIVAVDIQDPGNLGAIVRVAEAAGASRVIAAGTSADPFGWKALRGSMGSALRIAVARERNIEAALGDLRQRGHRIVATAPRGGRSVFEVNYSGPTAVVVGGEGQGLSPAVLAAADERVTIPMQAPVESLNTAVTAAIIAYEALRQRVAVT